MKIKKPHLWDAVQQSDPLRTPVNPLTGRPNEPGSPDPAHPESAIDVRAYAAGEKDGSSGARAAAGSPAFSGAHYARGRAAARDADVFDAGAYGTRPFGSAGRGAEGGSRPGAPGADRSPQGVSSAAGKGSGASAAEGGAATDEAFGPTPFSPAPRATAPDWLRNLFNSRLAAFLVLFVLAAMLLSESFLLLVVVLFGGYVLLDRFIDVRHAILVGGTAWCVTLFLGSMMYSNFPLVYLDFRWVFVFLGFVVCLAACGLFFGARAAYQRGVADGQAGADTAIAQHLVSRLIENPDDWDDLDSDYLEVEAALNRVRARERMSEQALRDESRRKDDLVTYLAHDLKTPLASVVGYLSLLNEAPDLPAEQRVRFCGIALDKAHRLDALIEEFFDITRFDFHDIVLTRGYVDLNLMLAQVADEFYPTLTDQHKTVELDVPLGLTVLVDGDKMARVFNNVMKNAIAYSYEGTAIRVDAERRPQDHACVIRFENQGDPIPKAKLDVIFEKFYRLDAARATNRGGAGLGLAIAKEIVTAHGGTIACSSDAAHTVFTITLPE